PGMGSAFVVDVRSAEEPLGVVVAYACEEVAVLRAEDTDVAVHHDAPTFAVTLAVVDTVVDTQTQPRTLGDVPSSTGPHQTVEVDPSCQEHVADGGDVWFAFGRDGGQSSPLMPLQIRGFLGGR